MRKNLKEARQRAGMTQQQMADRLGGKIHMRKKRDLRDYTKIVIETDEENPVTIAEITPTDTNTAKGFRVRFVSKLENKNVKIGESKEVVTDCLEKQGILYRMRYEDSIMVCNDGRIYKKHRNGLYYLISHSTNANDTYLCLKVNDGGKDKTVLAHRLVAETFLENKDNLSTVNHIDGNKTNNAVDNLEWCSQADNVCHMLKMHSARYTTLLKRRRIEKKMPATKLSRNIGLRCGIYRDIENAVRAPTKDEAERIERFFGDTIENLLKEVAD